MHERKGQMGKRNAERASSGLARRHALLDKVAGCLIGQCLADALGLVVEGCPPAVCEAYVRDVLRRGDACGVSREPFAPGQYSDDSQLARELVVSFVSCGRFDPADYAERIAALFTQGRVVGQGMATEAAAHRLARGVPWQEAGTPPPCSSQVGPRRW